jgi:hypothetical protein
VPQNKFQFQKGLSLVDFLRNFDTEEKCFIYLKKERWPNGYVCQECSSSSFCFIKTRKLFQYNRCHHQTSVTRNTVFHSTNLPLKTWFIAMFFLTQSKNGISALELKRQLGVSYKTAWSMKHKLMQAMLETDQGLQLKGFIELDDAYIGGKQKGGKRGRGTTNKQPFLAAVEIDLDNKPLKIKLSIVESFSKKQVSSWAKKHLTSGCLVYSDGYNCFRSIQELGIRHIGLTIGKGNFSTDHPKFNWVNTAQGKVKNSLTGTLHYHKTKYTGRYLSIY